MEVQGKIISVSAPISGTSKAGKEWTKQEFILETQGEHPKKIVFSRMNKEKIEKYPIYQNTDVVVSFDVDAHEYNGRWFNSITAWKVESIEHAQQNSAPEQPVEDAPF